MNIDLEAQVRIDELEESNTELRALLEEAFILKDLAETDRDEWKERAAVLKGQLTLLMSDYKVADVL